MPSPFGHLIPFGGCIPRKAAEKPILVLTKPADDEVLGGGAGCRRVSSDYILGWGGKPQVLEASLSNIAKADQQS